MTTIASRGVLTTTISSRGFAHDNNIFQGGAYDNNILQGICSLQQYRPGGTARYFFIFIKFQQNLILLNDNCNLNYER